MDDVSDNGHVAAFRYHGYSITAFNGFRAVECLCISVDHVPMREFIVRRPLMVVVSEVFDRLLEDVAVLSDLASKLVLKRCTVIEVELQAHKLVLGRSRVARTMKSEQNLKQQSIRHFIPLGWIRAISVVEQIVEESGSGLRCDDNSGNYITCIVIDELIPLLVINFAGQHELLSILLEPQSKSDRVAGRLQYDELRRRSRWLIDRDIKASDLRAAPQALGTG